MYRDYCHIQDVDDHRLWHDCDTQPGQSGSAIWDYVNGGPGVLGVHRGTPDGTINWGPRFTWEKASRDLCGWIKDFPSAYAERHCS
jgi:V8-like Glu-specific endopeptidase